MTPTNLRPELAGHLRRRLEAFTDGFRHNLALVGPSGSGKTFQLQQLLASRPTRALLIYCPTYHESCRSFVNRLLSAILGAGLCGKTGDATASNAEDPVGRRESGGRASGKLAGSTAGGDSHAKPLEALLRRADTLLPRTAAAVRLVDPLLTRRLFGEAFCRALDVVSVLVEEQGLPCVLILDEFLLLEELGFAHAFHELGKRVMTWQSTLFILSSSHPYRARQILRERLQLLFGQFELLTLGALEPDETAAWVRQELRGVRGGAEMTPFLIRWLGPSPWCLSVFLKRLRELSALRSAPTSAEILFLETAWDVLGRSDGPLHQWCRSYTEGLVRERCGPRAMEALLQIAQGTRTATEIGKRIGRAGLAAALQLLVEQDLAQRNGMCWMVADPVLRCWLSTVVTAERSDTSLDDADARRRFEACLRSMWGEWIQAARLSFPDQIAELFARFGDETVSLDAKTGRLPRFESILRQAAQAAGGETYLIAEGWGKRWCATVREGAVDEGAVAKFEAFCRGQTQKPSRKVVITKTSMEQNAKVMAKAASMWVWESEELKLLLQLYGKC